VSVHDGHDWHVSSGPLEVKWARKCWSTKGMFDPSSAGILTLR
jgi:hypothetical protein